MSAGMPAELYLQDFGTVVSDAFGNKDLGVYHVGSSLKSKKWRDVDVRVILEDKVYEEMGFGDPKHPWENPKWVAWTKAFSALGRQMTGLPIDFQIQQMTLCNQQFPSQKGHTRSFLGFVAKRKKKA
jgi:hypothetical protein